MCAVGEQVILGCRANRGCQLAPNFLLQEANHSAHPLQGKAAAAQLAITATVTSSSQV